MNREALHHQNQLLFSLSVPYDINKMSARRCQLSPMVIHKVGQAVSSYSSQLAPGHAPSNSGPDGAMKFDAINASKLSNAVFLAQRDFKKHSLEDQEPVRSSPKAKPSNYHPRSESTQVTRVREIQGSAIGQKASVSPVTKEVMARNRKQPKSKEVLTRTYGQGQGQGHLAIGNTKKRNVLEVEARSGGGDTSFPLRTDRSPNDHTAVSTKLEQRRGWNEMESHTAHTPPTKGRVRGQIQDHRKFEELLLSLDPSKTSSSSGKKALLLEKAYTNLKELRQASSADWRDLAGASSSKQPQSASPQHKLTTAPTHHSSSGPAVWHEGTFRPGPTFSKGKSVNQRRKHRLLYPHSYTRERVEPKLRRQHIRAPTLAALAKMKGGSKLGGYGIEKRGGFGKRILPAPVKPLGRDIHFSQTNYRSPYTTHVVSDRTLLRALDNLQDGDEEKGRPIRGEFVGMHGQSQKMERRDDENCRGFEVDNGQTAFSAQTRNKAYEVLLSDGEWESDYEEGHLFGSNGKEEGRKKRSNISLRNHGSQKMSVALSKDAIISSAGDDYGKDIPRWDTIPSSFPQRNVQSESKYWEDEENGLATSLAVNAGSAVNTGPGLMGRHLQESRAIDMASIIQRLEDMEFAEAAIARKWNSYNLHLPQAGENEQSGSSDVYHYESAASAMGPELNSTGLHGYVDIKPNRGTPRTSLFSKGGPDRLYACTNTGGLGDTGAAGIGCNIETGGGGIILTNQRQHQVPANSSHYPPQSRTTSHYLSQLTGVDEKDEWYTKASRGVFSRSALTLPMYQQSYKSVVDSRERYRRHLQAMGEEESQGFNPWEFADRMTEELLNLCVSGIAAEVKGITSNCVEDSYGDESSTQ